MQGRINPLWGPRHFLLNGPPSPTSNRAHKKYLLLLLYRLSPVLPIRKKRIKTFVSCCDIFPSFFRPPSAPCATWAIFLQDFCKAVIRHSFHMFPHPLFLTSIHSTISWIPLSSLRSLLRILSHNVFPCIALIILISVVRKSCWVVIVDALVSS